MKLLNPVDVYYCLKPDRDKEMPLEEQQQVFGELVEKGTPFFAGRIGMSEARVLRDLEFRYKKDYQPSLDQLCKWSGFFPNDFQLMEEYRQLEIKALKNADYILKLHGKGEAYLIKKYCRNDISFVHTLCPWRTPYPWTKCLEGKKVLVIHPFAETIRKQYLKRKFLFPDNPDLLPEFELHTIKAVQTIAGQKDERFGNWFDALEYMEKETLKIDYDVALIGCGAYGFPLASFCKEQGHGAVHVGGDLQILFGIKGSRWEQRDDARQIFNEYWVKPDESETPLNAAVVENGCYW